MNGLYLDAILIVLILIFGVVGAVKGFFKSILSLIGFVGALIISVVFREQAAALMESLFGLETFLDTTIVSKLGEINTSLTQIGSTQEELITILNASGMNTILIAICIRLVTGYVITDPISVAGIVSPQIAHYATIAAGTFVLFVVLRLAVLLLNFIFGKLAKGKVLGKLNRFLGFLFGLVKGAAISVAVLALGSILSLIPAIGTWIETTMSTTYVTKYAYDGVNKFVTEKISGFDLGSLTEGAETPETPEEPETPETPETPEIPEEP